MKKKKLYNYNIILYIDIFEIHNIIIKLNYN